MCVSRHLELSPFGCKSLHSQIIFAWQRNTNIMASPNLCDYTNIPSSKSKWCKINDKIKTSNHLPCPLLSKTIREGFYPIKYTFLWLSCYVMIERSGWRGNNSNQIFLFSVGLNCRVGNCGSVFYINLILHIFDVWHTCTCYMAFVNVYVPVRKTMKSHLYGRKEKKGFQNW